MESAYYMYMHLSQACSSVLSHCCYNTIVSPSAQKNFPVDTQLDQLIVFFEQAGPVEQVKMRRDESGNFKVLHDFVLQQKTFSLLK